MSDISSVKLHYVETLDEAQAFLRWLSERRPLLAVDTETTGLNWTAPNFLRMVQFADAEQGWAISAREWRGVVRRALDALASTHQPVAFWNVQFDMHALDAAGLPLPAWHTLHDGVVMDHLLNPLRGHGLKAAADRLYPGASSGQGLLRAGMNANGWSWETVPDDFPPYHQYAALDAVLTARLCENYWPQVQPMRAAYDREMATRAILWRAERRGMRVDVDYTARLRHAWQAEADTLRVALAALGIKNPSSNRDIEAVLKAAGWEPEEFTPTGAAKLDKVILQQLAGKLGVEVAPLILRYKRLVKWTSAYLDSFLGLKDSRDCVHPSVNTLAAKTGRMSINGPALQTLPRGPEIRRCIIPFNGESILAIDWDGQEARVFAHFCQDPNLMRAFAEGADVHRFAAAQAYGIPQEQVTPGQRQVAKNVTFAKLYGAGPAKIADTAGITQPEAEEFITAYDRAFPSIPAFMRQVEGVGRLRLRDEGRAYVQTWGGRNMLAPEDGIFKLVNGLIQGSCADILKQVIIDLDAVGLGDLILLPVHDELLFSVPHADFEDVRRAASEVMTAVPLSVPLTVHASEPMQSWGGDLEISPETAAA